MSQINELSFAFVSTTLEQDSIAGAKTFLDPFTGAAGIYDTAPITTEANRVLTNSQALLGYVTLSGSNTISGEKTFSTCPKATAQATESDHLITLGQALSGFAQADTTLTAGDGLSGGGNLNTNRSFAVDNTVLRTAGGQNIATETTLGYNVDLQSNEAICSKGYAIIVSSDERLKQNIVPADLEASYRLLDAIPMIEYDWNALSGRDGHGYGWSAQKFQQEAPEVVEEMANGFLGIKDRELIPKLWAQNKIQKDKIASLEEELGIIKAALGL